MQDQMYQDVSSQCVFTVQDKNKTLQIQYYAMYKNTTHTSEVL